MKYLTERRSLQIDIGNLKTVLLAVERQECRMCVIKGERGEKAFGVPMGEKRAANAADED